MGRGNWVCGSDRLTVPGSVVCGLWSVGCGLWVVVCGLWSLGYGPCAVLWAVEIGCVGLTDS